jgi:hypothetical protein
MTLLTVRFIRETAGGAEVMATPVEEQPGAVVDTVDWRAGSALHDMAMPRTATSAVCQMELAVQDIVAGAYVRGRSTGALFGHTSVTQVGVDGVATVEVPLNGLAKSALGRYKTSWKWQWSADGKTWTTFATSSHPIFVVHAAPAPPWGLPGEADRFVPRKSALTLACRWAVKATSAEEILDALTSRVYKLGGRKVGDLPIQYIGGGATFVTSSFNLEGFLALANRSATNDRFIMNCADVATAVAVLAACLGVPARIAAIASSPAEPCATMRTNRIRPFGEKGGCFQTIVKHEFVVLGELDASAKVWDPCFRVDTDAFPEFAPETWQLPLGVQCGVVPSDGDDSFLGRFLIKKESGAVVWKGRNGVRPLLRANHSTGSADASEDSLRGYYRRLLESPVDDQEKLQFEPAILPALGITHPQAMALDLPSALVRGWSFQWQPTATTRFFGDIALLPSTALAQSVLIDLAAGCETPMVPCKRVGASSLLSIEAQMLVMRRGNIVLRLISDPKRLTAVLPAGMAIDQVLTRLGAGGSGGIPLQPTP